MQTKSEILKKRLYFDQKTEYRKTGGKTMRKDLFELLNQLTIEKVIRASDLKPYLYDRTLLYGYTCERKTFHVYMKDQEIFAVVYENDYSAGKPRNMKQIAINSNQDYIPDKRLYPEKCDYHFCLMLKKQGMELPFTTWHDNVDTDCEYYGFILEDAEEA